MAAGSTAVISVRTAAATDAGCLAAFAERTFREAFAAQNRPEDVRAYVSHAYTESLQRREIVDPAVDTLLAEVDGMLVGFAQLRTGNAPACVDTQRSIELWRFYIDSPWQGRGVAQALMSTVETAARHREARVLWLGVWERNARARAFYRKCGFVNVGAQKFVLGTEVQTDDVMARSLNSAQ